MSRIGKKLIAIPTGVEVNVTNGVVKVKGSRGELTQALHPVVRISVNENTAEVSVLNPEDKEQRALWGLFRSLLANMVQGVTEGFTKQLELIGVGYKVAVSGNKITLNLGFSHPVEMQVPEGVEALAEKNTITLKGNDKQVVGEFAANIRKLRKPEPYKGKGIRYVGEHVRRKAGKAAKAVGG